MTSSRRFDIALSFPGEHRDFVGQAADCLAATFNQERVLYDKYHEAEFARLDLDVYLPGLYRTQSELSVVFLCPEYATKRWCKLEWRHIRQLIATAEEGRIMLLSFGNPGDLSEQGILDGDGYIDILRLTPEAVAEKIIKRFRLNQGITPQPTSPQSPSASTGKIAISRLTHSADKLIGRDTELAMLDDAWNDAHTNLIVVRGKGGEGKTSLVSTWMAELARKNWRGAENVFDWSFYSQGTRDQGSASAETFICVALQFFGDPDPNQGSAHERGARLARLVGARRCLLVLDGLEPLQYAPGPMHGQLKDPGMVALLKGLVAHNTGLCVITTREKVDEIKQHYGRLAIDHDLAFLSPSSGAALLHFAGAQRAGKKAISSHDPELRKTAQEVNGHALTLFLIGQYLRLTQTGDIRRRDRMKLAEAEAEYKNDATRPYGHAFKAIAAYETWFAAGDDQAKRQLALLRLLGLFDRPASRVCLTALRANPKIPGLNDSLTDVPEKDWQLALARLQEIKLVSVKDDESVDCHPLFREYFATQWQTRNPSVWQVGHKRLYDYLCASTKEGDEPTLEDLQPLYQAVAHGCHAGLQQEAREKVYRDRILRGTGNGGFYSTRKLGAFGSDLGAVACFFEIPWSSVSPVLTEAEQAWLLNQAAYSLHALGRLTEALEPMLAGLEMGVKQENWNEAAIRAGNLSELELTLGLLAPKVLDGIEMTGAVAAAEQSVTYAERSGDVFQRHTKRAIHADAMHQVGRRDEAAAYFREAEAMQAKRQLNYQLLYSLWGFWYCDLLLAGAERAAGRKEESAKGLKACRAVQKRATQTLQWMIDAKVDLLSIAVDHLTLGRAALYEAILNKSSLDPCHSSLDAAMNGLRRAGVQDYLPRGLLTRAWYSFAEATEHRLHENERKATVCLDRAQRDLDEAWEIAGRGSMKLHMADIHLYRARLFHGEAAYPWTSPQTDLSEARRLIETCGYWRRKEELEDAETVIFGKPGASLP